MKLTLIGGLGAIGLALGLGGVSALGQSAVPNTVDGHVAAAKAAGGDLWPSIVGQLCGTAERAPAGRGGAAAAGRGQTPPGPPPRSQWYHEPAKVFDNMYLMSTVSQAYGGVSSWALKTSAGIILIDATYDYSVKDLVDGGMRQLGLDPSQIKDIVVTHGHGDHFGGVKYLQELYNAHVYLTSEDWDLMASTARGGNLGQPVPKKDLIASDGQKLTLGDETITMYVTPGHTLGTISMLIPVKINGAPHIAAFWGGTAISRNTPADRLKMYSASAQRFAGIAQQAKADIMLSNHDAFGEYFKRIAAMKANPTGPNPFVVGTDGVLRYLQVLDHCSQALALAQAQAE